jgi:hypothetical protein
MAEIRTVTTLQFKRDEIETAIANYEKRLAQARADLAHINAAITLFTAAGDAEAVRSYVNLNRLFRYGELPALCKAALARGPKNTREIAAYVIKAKGFGAGDKVLANAIAYRAIHALRRHRRNGAVVSIGRNKAALIWRLRE